MADLLQDRARIDRRDALVILDEAFEADAGLSFTAQLRVWAATGETIAVYLTPDVARALIRAVDRPAPEPVFVHTPAPDRDATMAALLRCTLALILADHLAGVALNLLGVWPWP